jgi:diguanylate cyclase (GGDEF)-like protein
MDQSVKITPAPSPATLRAALWAAAVPLAGWAAHAVYLHRCLILAGRDPLTSLMRREAFTVRASRLIARHGDNVLVVVVDVDHFKTINDTLGHAAGDNVLAELGLRLQSWTGHDGASGRLGGDEFALVLARPAAQHPAQLLALAAALRQPVRLDGQDLDVQVSLGAATPALLPGVRDLSGLQRAADAAMYEGKHTGIPVMARIEHLRAASVNGRRLGRAGTGHELGQAA